MANLFSRLKAGERVTLRNKEIFEDGTLTVVWDRTTKKLTVCDPDEELVTTMTEEELWNWLTEYKEASPTEAKKAPPPKKKVVEPSKPKAAPPKKRKR